MARKGIRYSGGWRGGDDLIREVEELVRGGRFLDAFTWLPSGRPYGENPVLDQVCIAVRSLEGSRLMCESLGLHVTAVETIASKGVRVGIAPVGAAPIELLEVLGQETVVGRFLSSRGEGVHHVAFRIHGINASINAMREEGVRLASSEVGVDAGGHRYFFVDPASMGGMLVELVEDREEGSS